MILYEVLVKNRERSVTKLLIFSPGLDSGMTRVKRYLQENNPNDCVPETTIQFNEIEPSKILKTTDKKPKAHKKK